MALVNAFDEDAFDEFLESRLILDQSRKEFLDDTRKTLAALCSGSLTRCTGFRRLLLGLEGVGKTTLLQEISLAGKIATKDQLLVCEIRYNNANTADEPTSFMFKSLPWMANAHHLFKYRGSTPAEINNTMQELGLRMLVTVDELENVFYPDFTKGKRIINQLYAIGDLDGGAVHCILSGSSSDLRELAFGKLSKEKRVFYANYTGRSLNSTKFCPRWIYPFCNRDKFVQAVEHMKKPFTHPIDDDSSKSDGADEDFLER